MADFVGKLSRDTDFGRGLHDLNSSSLVESHTSTVCRRLSLTSSLAMVGHLSEFFPFRKSSSDSGCSSSSSYPMSVRYFLLSDVNRSWPKWAPRSNRQNMKQEQKTNETRANKEEEKLQPSQRAHKDKKSRRKKSRRLIWIGRVYI